MCNAWIVRLFNKFANIVSHQLSEDERKWNEWIENFFFSIRRHLASNPFNCNCHLAWFSDWLRKRALAGSQPTCAVSGKGKEIFIRDLPHHEFKCGSDDDGGCLGDGYCPPSCVCTGTIVRCSRNKLKEIPRGIPAETTELYLESNEIGMIHSDRISHLKSLTRM